MMLYLTGADTSLTKSEVAPQNDAAKSLGGYVSSSPVPNGELNILFDLISAYTLEKRKRETLGIALMNTLQQSVTNVTLKVVTGKDTLASFKIAAVALDPSLAMEHIYNRYAEPIAAEFHSADFQRASVEMEILKPAGRGEEIALFPFGVTIEVHEEGMERTWNAFDEAFMNDPTYGIQRVSESVFRISRRDEEVIEPTECSYIATAGFSARFDGEMRNGTTNEVVLVENGIELAPNSGIGLWIQRDLKNYRYPSNMQLIEEFKKKVVHEEEETAEIVIDYDLVPVEQDHYSDSAYNQEDY